MSIIYRFRGLWSWLQAAGSIQKLCTAVRRLCSRARRRAASLPTVRDPRVANIRHASKICNLTSGTRMSPAKAKLGLSRIAVRLINLPPMLD